MIKNYFDDGFDPVSFTFSVIIGFIIMMSLTGYHTWYAVIGFFTISTTVIVFVDMLFYQLLERGDMHG